MAVGVLLFVGYLGFQLLRFSKPPEVAVTDPATAASTVDETATSYTLRGTLAAWSARVGGRCRS